MKFYISSYFLIVRLHNFFCFFNFPAYFSFLGLRIFVMVPHFHLAVLSGVAPPSVCKNVPLNGPNPGVVGVDGSPRSTVNSTIQVPRRKFVDEGKLKKGEVINMTGFLFGYFTGILDIHMLIKQWYIVIYTLSS